MKKPWLFQQPDGLYGVFAIRTEAEGDQDESSKGCVIFFQSKDLVHYEEKGLLQLQEEGFIYEVRYYYNVNEKKEEIFWKDDSENWKKAEFQKNEMFVRNIQRCSEAEIEMVFKEHLEKNWKEEGTFEKLEGVCPSNSIEVDEKTAAYLRKKLMVPECRGIHKISMEQAKALYSDGTEVLRKIDWDAEKKEGYVHQEHFPFPFALHRADPCCMYWKNKYYFIATNDADDNHTLYMRSSDTLEGIIDAEEVLILDSKTYPGIGGLLWAPEFHEIDGQLYIFHAATEGEFYREESRVMKLREGGNPMCKEDWSAPKLVVKRDGTPLCEAGNVISLDMTTFVYQGNYYAMWSQRQFLPVDQGAWLYLAQIDKKEPWKLLNDPVCIAKPEYGWENNHTFVVEGPYALERNGQLMVTYSGAAVDATYAVGLLKPVMGSDIMDPQNWMKNNYPLLSSRSAEGEYGPGHNSYLLDSNGLVWNFYHARPGVEGPRSSCARRVHFDVDGEPILDLLEEQDIPGSMRVLK